MHRQRTHRRPRVYLAAPLFSESERMFNRTIHAALQEWIDVYLPQEQAGLASEMVKNGMPSAKAIRSVFDQDITAVADADALLILLDGRAIDEGAAFELGVAYTMGKPCIGLQTDSRRTHAWGNNPMIDQAARPVFDSLASLAEWARQFAEAWLQDDTESASGMDVAGKGTVRCQADLRPTRASR